MAEVSTDFAIPVVLVGLGHMGRAIARAALFSPQLQVAGAVDPAYAGKRLDEVLGAPAPALTIAAVARPVLEAAGRGVVLHATASRLKEVWAQLEGAVRAGFHVVSTCEELAYPWWAEPQLADRLADLCEASQVAVVGTGVNPGFVLDRLPALLSQVTGPVRHVRVVRVQDACSRREPLQRKVGLGLTEREFSDAVERGEVGHVGLPESALLVADGCGLDVDEVDVEEELEPLIADEDVPGPIRIRAGQVAGLQQTARAFLGGTERVRLELVIQAGAEEPRDEVELDAGTPLRLRIAGGIPGDEATAWAVVNAAPAVARLQGLITVLELPAGR